MRLLAFIGAIATVVVLGSAVFFLGGFYSVAATAPDFGVVDALLIKIRLASIDRYATERLQTPLDDPMLVRAGARAFAARGCPTCHGAPGVDWAKFSEGLRPDPPDLKKIVMDREPRHLFWVVKNGIKMTGMPSFGTIGASDQEIWSITAFLKKLPGVSETDFKAWSAPEGSGNQAGIKQ